MNDSTNSLNDNFVFYVRPNFRDTLPEKTTYAILTWDNWDDWAKYCTQLYLEVITADGITHEIGHVKIGQIDLQAHEAASDLPANHRSPSLPRSFSQLSETFFSVGQDEDYYENLKKLDDDIREQVLRSLRDMAFDEVIWDAVKNKYVTRESLLRSVSNSEVVGLFRRTARGEAKLTGYRFSFTPPKRMGDGKPPYILKFRVISASIPPTNVHVLIGRNGAGKTYLLNLMTKALVESDAAASQSGSFAWADDSVAAKCFANLVFVSFSAFDNSELLPEGISQEGGLKYSYIGLRRNAEISEGCGSPKSTKMLTTEFVKSLGTCQIGARRKRWTSAINVLETDPTFLSDNLNELINADLSDSDARQQVAHIFGHLSSGHKIVLLTITRLVETAEERSLVLIDEPEAHLHPPLLSAFTRALSDLLMNRNGVALVATHSPVILQEVPKTCVWILTRFGKEAKAERPQTETFGENVGILSREVFQLELTHSGYHRLLAKAVEANATYESAVEDFNGQLGAEGRAVLQAMFLEKNQPSGADHA
jgi:ABC-type transport system involved in cytochrome c biogenesis ATPase subunit